MAATPRDVLQEMDSLETLIAAAFLAEVRAIVGDARMVELEELVRRGSVAEIAAALGISASALVGLQEAVRTTYLRGGQFEAGHLPALRRPNGARLRLSFDIRSVRAETWLRVHSSQMVVELRAGQLEVIQQALAAGARAGWNPRRTALELVGRVSPQTGRRTGGLIGLSSQQTEWVLAAREQLLSGDPTKMRRYLLRERRDRRFDGIVNRAIAAGRPVALKDVDRIAGRYADRLLKLRGDNIARTETLAAFNEARDETYRQAIDQGLNPENVTKGWNTINDGRQRHTHGAMHKQRKRFDEPFVSPSGARLMHPGDTSLGAGASEIVNCRCVHTMKIDHLAEAMNGPNVLGIR